MSSQDRELETPNLSRILRTDDTAEDFSGKSFGEDGSECAVDSTNTVYPNSENLRAAARARPAHHGASDHALREHQRSIVIHTFALAQNYDRTLMGVENPAWHDGECTGLPFIDPVCSAFDTS